MSIKFFQTTSSIEKADFSPKEIERVLKCMKEYHRKSSDTHTTNVMSAEVNSAANGVLQRLDDDKTGLVGISECTARWLKDETIRALFPF